MSPEAKRERGRERVREHRRELRAKGLRPVTLWLPDTRSLEFTREAHRQARAVSESPHAAEDQAFVDAISIDLFK